MHSDNLETLVRSSLSEIIDPETGLNIMRMDLIHNVQVKPNGSVCLVFRPSSPVCPMAYVLANSIQKKLETIREIKSIEIKVENFERAAHLEGILQTSQKLFSRKEG